MIDKISVFRFCGLTRSPQVGSATTVASDAPNWVYRYDSRPGSWTQILPQSMYTAGPHDASGPHVEEVEEPLPRYAHQVVYNPRTKAVFMHGGNAGVVGQQLERGREDESNKERRLDDFWRMSLIRFVDGCCHRSCINLVSQAWLGGGHSEGNVPDTTSTASVQFHTISIVALINSSGSARCAKKCPQSKPSTFYKRKSPL
jgi:hypothetical protein